MRVASVESRGRVFAAYTMINLTVVTAGMQLMNLGTPMSFELFSLTAMLYSLAAVPVALTKTSAPTAAAPARLRLLWLLAVSPAAMLGSLFAGLANAAFWTLSPLYGRAVGLTDHGIALFMTVGRAERRGQPMARRACLSDRCGRRPVSVAIAASRRRRPWRSSFMTGGRRATTAAPCRRRRLRRHGVSGLCPVRGARQRPRAPQARRRGVERAAHDLLDRRHFRPPARFAADGASRQPRPFRARRARAGAAGARHAGAHPAAAEAAGGAHEGYVVVPRTTPAVFDLDPRAEPEPADTRRHHAAERGSREPRAAHSDLCMSRTKAERPSRRSRFRRSALRIACRPGHRGLEIGVDDHVVVLGPVADLVGGLRHAPLDHLLGDPGRARAGAPRAPPPTAAG